MNPQALMSLASLGGALRGGGSTRNTQTSQQNVSVASPVAQSMNLAFNPALSALTGGGVAPGISGNLSGGLSQIPTSNANPSTSVGLNDGAGSVLPRTSPTGYGVGPGFGLYPSPYQNPPRGLMDNDLFILAVIAGAVFWFTSQE